MGKEGRRSECTACDGDVDDGAAPARHAHAHARTHARTPTRAHQRTQDDSASGEEGSADAPRAGGSGSAPAGPHAVSRSPGATAAQRRSHAALYASRARHYSTRRSRGSYADDSDGDCDADGDTTAAQAARGKDIQVRARRGLSLARCTAHTSCCAALARQALTRAALDAEPSQGIPWHRLNFSRAKYRETRLRQYKNYENLTSTSQQLDALVPPPARRDGEFYQFARNTRHVKSTIVHFQLRNLVWATGPHDVYTLHRCTVRHYDCLARRSSVALDLSGDSNGVGRVQVSTLCVKEGILAAGGFGGEIVCRSVGSRCVAHRARVSRNENAITNALEVYTSPGAASPRILACNNDRALRQFDVETFRLVAQRDFDWAVNHATVSPDGRLACVVGDDPEALLLDTRTNETVATLRGHLDYGFATAWHPDGWVFATGNQDTTCRIWDRRYMSSALAIFRGRIGAARSLRFSPNGDFLAMAEPADFVHVVDARGPGAFSRCQEIDLFGEVAGVAFAAGEGTRGAHRVGAVGSAVRDSLFVGVADRTYGSLLEFQRARLDTLSSKALLAL